MLFKIPFEVVMAETVETPDAVTAPTMLNGPATSGGSNTAVCAIIDDDNSAMPAANSRGPRYGPSATMVSLTKCTARSTPPREDSSLSPVVLMDPMMASLEPSAMSCRLEIVPEQSSTPGHSRKKHQKYFQRILVD